MADLGRGATGAKPSDGTTRAQATSGPFDTTGAPSAASPSATNPIDTDRLRRIADRKAWPFSNATCFALLDEIDRCRAEIAELMSAALDQAQELANDG